MNKKQYSMMLVLALIAGLMGGVVSSWFLVGKSAFAEKKAEPQKVIEAREFRLVDENRKIRAILGPTATGVSFVFMDEFGNFRSGITPSGMMVLDEKGKPRIMLVLNDDDTVRLELYGESDKHSATLMLSENGFPGLKLTDDNEKSSALLGVSPRGDVFMALEKKGKVIWQAP